MTILKKNPILITGSHRSGSTWVGQMIAYASSVSYIHEPLNLNHKPGICNAKFNYQFPYICKKNENVYLNAFEDCFNFKYHFLEDLKTIESLKDFFRSTREFFRFSKYRVLNNRPLIKDPIAVFSTEWLAKRFNMDVVVLIRHPAAFAGSIKKVKWSHPFDHFLKQPLLMNDHLHEFRLEIEEFSKTEKDILDQAILLWNLIHHMILKYQNNNPDWIFLKHEDLSRRPLEEFRNLYNNLDLKFTKNIEDKIKAFSLLDNSEQIKGKSRSTILKWQKRLIGDHSESRMRDSKKNVWSWKNRLTNDEVKKIKENTQKIASKFYTEEDWAG
jgi:hypothetical protein